MRKALTYSSFVAASVVLIVLFMTSKTYTQLGLAVLLYIPLVFFAYRAFRGKILTIKVKRPLIVVRPPVKLSENGDTETASAKKEVVAIADIDKRAFLKLIGGVGLSVFIFSLINRKLGGIFGGGASVAETVALKDAAGNKINPLEKSPTDGYKITEIDNSDVLNYFGYTDNTGAWYIMRQDTDGGGIRYTRGSINFTANWSNHEHLPYDYYNNVFK